MDYGVAMLCTLLVGLIFGNESDPLNPSLNCFILYHLFFFAEFI